MGWLLSHVSMFALVFFSSKSVWMQSCRLVETNLHEKLYYCFFQYFLRVFCWNILHQCTVCETCLVRLLMQNCINIKQDRLSLNSQHSTGTQRCFVLFTYLLMMIDDCFYDGLCSVHCDIYISNRYPWPNTTSLYIYIKCNYYIE